MGNDPINYTDPSGGIIVPPHVFNILEVTRGIGRKILDFAATGGFDLGTNDERNLMFLKPSDWRSGRYAIKNITMNVDINVDIIDPDNTVASGDVQTIKALGRNLTSTFEFDTHAIDDKGNSLAKSVTFNINLIVRTVRSLEMASDQNFLIYMVDDIPGKPVGYAQIGGYAGAVEKHNIGLSFWRSKTTIHEIGHMFGFTHIDNTIMHPFVDEDPKDSKFNTWDLTQAREIFTSWFSGLGGNFKTGNYYIRNPGNNSKAIMSKFLSDYKIKL
jgi:hypothetical protein